MFEDRKEPEAAQDSEEGSNRLAWFLTGVLVGATVAILYTPKSGKAARSYIADKTEAGQEAVADKTHDIAESSREMFDRGRKVIEDAAELFDRARRLVRG